MAEACLEDCENHFGGSCINMQACVILWLKSLLRLRVVWMAQIPVENSGGVILLGTKDAVTCRVCYIHRYQLFLDLSRWTFHILYIHYYLDVCTHLTMYSPKHQMSQLVIIPARALPPCNHDHWMIVFEALWYTNSYVYVNLQSQYIYIYIYIYAYANHPSQHSPTTKACILFSLYRLIGEGLSENCENSRSAYLSDMSGKPDPILNGVFSLMAAITKPKEPKDIVFLVSDHICENMCTPTLAV